MPTQIIAIKGMHCRSCELLVQDELAQLQGVKKVKASSKSHTAELTIIDETIDEAELAAAVERAGYELGESSQLPLLSKNTEAWQQVSFMFILLGLGLVLLNKLGLANGFGMNTTTEPSDLLATLLIGLTAGVSTCMALVGGLTIAISARFAKTHRAVSGVKKMTPIMVFQLGRVVGFVLLGALLGWFGSILQPTPFFTALLTLAVAGVMVLLGVQLTGLFPRLSQWSFSLPSALAEKLGLQSSKQTTYSHLQTALTGALTFFVPCGFTQSMQLLAASSGSAYSGALIMGVFALGTLPGLAAVGSLGSLVSTMQSRVFTRFVGVVVVVMALTSATAGFNLLGAANAFGGTNAPTTTAPSGEVQEITMVQNAYGYSPASFTVKKGQPVRWVIDSKDSYSCASSILLAKYGINANLKPGKNIFEFTPTQAGNLKFSCGMGMYSGVIKVVE